MSTDPRMVREALDDIGLVASVRLTENYRRWLADLCDQLEAAKRRTAELEDKIAKAESVGRSWVRAIDAANQRAAP